MDETLMISGLSRLFAHAESFHKCEHLLQWGTLYTKDKRSSRVWEIRCAHALAFFSPLCYTARRQIRSLCRFNNSYVIQIKRLACGLVLFSMWTYMLYSSG
jgi:hypothetical protein